MRWRLPLALAFATAFAGEVIAAGIDKAPINGTIKGQTQQPVPTYRFTLVSFTIKHTRSVHNDTDYIEAELTGPGNAKPRQVKHFGDVNDGNHSIGITFDASLVLPQYVDLKYTIFNQGSGMLEQSMNDAPLGLLVIPGIAFADCNGPVAAGSDHFTAIELAQQTANGQVVSGQDHSPGSDSPNGCGGNSDYYVSWTVRRL